MYTQTKWWDEATEFTDHYHFTDNGDGTAEISPFPGEVIQHGTPQNQFNFDNLENGVQGAHIAAAILMFGYLHQQRANEAQFTTLSEETLGEESTITLTNSKHFPFNSTMDNPPTIALNTRRRNLFYSVETEVVSHNGEVGEIHITGKALNGFKISFDGPATEVTLIIRIKGGMT